MKTVTLPEAVIFGTMIGLGVTGFSLARKTNQLLDYAILMFINCIVRFWFTPERMRLRRGWGDNNDGYRSAVFAGCYGVRGLRIYQ